VVSPFSKPALRYNEVYTIVTSARVTRILGDAEVSGVGDREAAEAGGLIQWDASLAWLIRVLRDDDGQNRDDGPGDSGKCPRVKDCIP